MFIQFIITLVVFLIMDSVWISNILSVYKSTLGSVLKQNPDFLAAGLFYVFYIAGLVFFVVGNNAVIGDLTTVAIHGAAYGFVCYMTFCLTNQAVIEAWTWQLVIYDTLWGTIATSGASVLSVKLLQYVYSS